MMRKRLLRMLCACALVAGLMPIMPVASVAAPIDTDVVIHKMSVDETTGLAQHNGEEIDDFTGTNLEGSTPLEGVIFKYWTINDTVTPAELAAIQGLSSIAQCEAFATANPKILFNATTTAATDIDGIVRINDMPEGMYLFAEVNGSDLNVFGYVGVPFVLELPAMKTDGTAYFGTGANALHVYPKNVLRSPGLVLETREDNGTLLGGARIGSSEFLVSVKTGPGTFEPLSDIGAGGKIILPTGLLTLANLPAGEYQLTNVGAPTGYLTDDRPIYFTVAGGVVTFDSAGSNPKSYFTAAADDDNDTITLLLRREPADPIKEANGELEGTYQVGDTITYTVKLGIPSDIAEYATYKMTDTLDTHLSWAGTDMEGDVQVTSGVAILEEDTHFVKAILGKTLTLDFDPSELADFAGATLTVTYTVVINVTAIMGEDLENRVSFEFDNGHGDGGTKEPPPPVVWTGGARFVKVDAKNPKVFLPGAQFKIATEATGTSFLTWTAPLISANSAGSFITPTVGADIVMVSDTTGHFEIKGLAGGTYYLVEIKAPTVGGTTYNLLRGPAAFEVTKTSYDTGQELTVENKSGLQIPQTGGIGTAVFTVSGACLMVAAVFLRRRKRSPQE